MSTTSKNKNKNKNKKSTYACVRVPIKCSTCLFYTGLDKLPAKYYCVELAKPAPISDVEERGCPYFVHKGETAGNICSVKIEEKAVSIHK